MSPKSLSVVAVSLCGCEKSDAGANGPEGFVAQGLALVSTVHPEGMRPERPTGSVAHVFTLAGTALIQPRRHSAINPSAVPAYPMNSPINSQAQGFVLRNLTPLRGSHMPPSPLNLSVCLICLFIFPHTPSLCRSAFIEKVTKVTMFLVTRVRLNEISTSWAWSSFVESLESLTARIFAYVGKIS